MTCEIQVRPEEGVQFRRVFEDGRKLDLCRMLFNWRLCLGHTKTPWYNDDEWCYANEATGIVAFLSWDLEGEPQGWIKHPDTGRYRPDGDPAREFNQRSSDRRAG